MSARDGNRHDALLIGAGFGGLAAACFLARQGLDTVVLEAGGEAGGYCRTIEDGDLTWNLSLYSLRGCRRGGPFFRLLEELDLAEEIEFLHSPGSYLVRAGEQSMPVTSEVEKMIVAAEGFVKGGGERLKRLIDRVLDFHPVRDYSLLSRETFTDTAARDGVTGRLLDAVGAPLMISLGLPPSRTSAYFAFMKYQFLFREGVSYPRGGPKSLVEGFMSAFTGAGGTVHFNERAGDVAPCAPGGWEVRTSRNRVLRARHIVFAGDATAALEMIAPHLPARLAGKPSGLFPSLPAALLFLEAGARTFSPLALDAWPHTVVLPDEGLETHYRNLRGGNALGGRRLFGLTSPSTWETPPDSGDTRPVTAFFLGTPGEEPDFASLLQDVREASGAPPGGLTLRRALGPADLQRLTLNRDGAFCGWEMGPERYGRARLPQKLLPGVYLAGHWVDPGPSLLNAALAGRKAALGILREAQANPR